MLSKQEIARMKVLLDNLDSATGDIDAIAAEGECIAFLIDHGRALLDIAKAWTKLQADCDASPCEYPCLRDDLSDWESDYRKSMAGEAVLP